MPLRPSKRFYVTAKLRQAHELPDDTATERDRVRSNARAWRQARKRAGLCVACGRKRRKDDGSYCWRCRGEMRERYHRGAGPAAPRRQRRTAVAKFHLHPRPRRSQSPAPPRPRNATPERERARQYMRGWRERRRAAGLCIQCGKARGVAAGSFCSPCRERYRAQDRARRARRRP
jgi:hypothetical protein